MMLQTQEERQIVLQLTNSSSPVWLGKYQNDSCFWSNDSVMKDWTNQMDEKTTEYEACILMTPKTGQLQTAPCEELCFYICTASPRFTSTDLNSHNLLQPGLVQGASLFNIIWDSSSVQAEEIYQSSSLFRGLRSGNLTERCYSTFMQLEELYLHRVRSTLEVLIESLHEHSKVKSLLLDTFSQYGRRMQNVQLSSPPPQWLEWSLQSFHQVVLEDPVYWLVALSARACLRNVVDQRLHQELELQGPSLKENRFYHMWTKEDTSLWIKSYKEVLKEHQDQIDIFKAINIFREHMINLKSFHRAVKCENKEDEKIHSRPDVL